MESSLRIVAITNCPAGIAHTYMVAEALEQKARSLGHTIKVETQGSSGVENRLSSEEIAAADYVILATGRGLSGDDRARFAGKKVYEIAISQALKNIDQIFSELPTNSQLFAADSGVKLGKQEVQSGSVMSHLMAGVSAALPFVIGGGILVALANMLVQFGLPYTDMSKGAPSFTWVVESIGYLGFTFMIPIMGAYIASSIADKPAFAPAFLVCYLANDKALLGTQSGAGFLGAVVLGLAIGYFVFWFRKVRLGKALQPLLGSMLIPFVTLLVFGVLQKPRRAASVLERASAAQIQKVAGAHRLDYGKKRGACGNDDPKARDRGDEKKHDPGSQTRAARNRPPPAVLQAQRHGHHGAKAGREDVGGAGEKKKRKKLVVEHKAPAAVVGKLEGSC